MAHPAAIPSSVRSAGVRDREMMQIDVKEKNLNIVRFLVFRLCLFPLACQTSSRLLYNRRRWRKALRNGPMRYY